MVRCRFGVYTDFTYTSEEYSRLIRAGFCYFYISTDEEDKYHQFYPDSEYVGEDGRRIRCLVPCAEIITAEDPFPQMFKECDCSAAEVADRIGDAIHRFERVGLLCKVGILLCMV